MTSKPKSLERELEKPDWKQWLPIFGLRQIYRANFIEKAPAVNDDFENHPIRYYGSQFYHAIATVGIATGTIYGLTELIEKLF